MKAKSLSLALLLLAGVATSAYAQEREMGGRGRLLSGAAPEAAQAPRARPAPEARSAQDGRAPRSHPPHTAATIGQPRPRELPSAEGARRDWNRGDGGRRDWGQRQGDRPDLARPGDSGRDRAGRDDRSPRPGFDGRDRGERERVERDRVQRDREQRDRVQRDRGDRNRVDRDRNWNSDRDRDRDRNWDSNRGRNWEGDRRVRPDRGPVWRQGRYPPSYNAHVRYRGHAWRAPPGYYVRSWRYGEVLPGAWYAQSYWLMDWWAYDLPEPPYGYEWVRVGTDAVLVDTFSGRIVQVVRLLFW